MAKIEYNSSHKILLVGEGDFSFALAISSAFPSYCNVVATSLDTKEEVLKKYPAAYRALRLLRAGGAWILHGVDATTMQESLSLGGLRFDRIIFNFPHAGFACDGGESNPRNIEKHSSLVRDFMVNAGKMLTKDGQVHMAHKSVFPYNRWKLEKHAMNNGLMLQETRMFNRAWYPNYCNRRGYGRRPGRTFPIEGHAVTYIFSKQAIPAAGDYRQSPSVQQWGEGLVLLCPSAQLVRRA